MGQVSVRNSSFDLQTSNSFQVGFGFLTRERLRGGGGRKREREEEVEKEKERERKKESDRQTDRQTDICRGVGMGSRGKQVGSMDEESQVRGCYNITFICTPTNQETMSVLEKTQANKTFRT